MIIPIGDEPNPPGIPYVNYGLIAVNVLVYLLVTLPLQNTQFNLSDPAAQDFLTSHGIDASFVRQLSAYTAFTWEWGFRPDRPSMGGLFSSLFLHADFWHLLGNMWFLWIFGDNVEHRLGPVSYLAMYLLTGVIATLTFGVFAWGASTTLIGASGAISGVQGFYFLWFPRNRVRVLVLLIVFLNIFLVPARLMIGFYLLWSNVLPLVLNVQSAVAYGAHIGGMLGGMGIAWVFNRYAESDGLIGALVRKVDHRRAAQLEAGVNFTPIGQRSNLRAFPGFGGRSSPPPLSGAEGFSHAVARGNFEMALRIYAELEGSERGSLPDGELMKLADHYTDQGDYDTALSVLQRFIAQHSSEDRAARAHLRAGLIHLHFKRQPTAAAQHLHAVLDMRPSAEMEQVVRDALAQIES